MRSISAKAANARGEVPDVPEKADIGYRANNALIAHDEDVVIPKDATEKINYEGELVVVIGKQAKHLTEGRRDVLRVRLHDRQRRQRAHLAARRPHFWRGKNADTFKPMGPWIETDVDLDAMETNVRLNGEGRTQFNTNDMIFGIPHYIAAMTQYLTLYPGDVIWMGTDGTVARPEARRRGGGRDFRRRHAAQQIRGGVKSGARAVHGAPRMAQCSSRQVMYRTKTVASHVARVVREVTEMTGVETFRCASGLLRQCQ